MRLSVLNFPYQISYLTTSSIVYLYQSHKEWTELPEANQEIKHNIGANGLYFCMCKLQFSPKASDNIKILRCEVFHPAAQHCVEQTFQLEMAGKLYCFILLFFIS